MQVAERILGRIVAVAALIGVASLVALMALTVVTVTFRAISVAFPGTYVLAELLLIPAVAFSLTYAAWCGAHTRVELLTDRLPRRISGPLNGLMLAAGCGFWGFVAFSAYEDALKHGAQGEVTPLLDIPVAPFRWLMVVALGLLIVVLLFRALQAALGQEPTE
ncbi:MAG: TRAP transporter small permease [Vannielia sp.]|uniref:TRAP transporter small permease n=1 Tax=Rhodobacterales TaxID=204455 RepID=UPI0020951EF9|nr:TRAP transporter small permease [Oceanicola sp. 502str15]MCO6381575.1 TRAP transporter small permease subunit [Oceanicola sp. 502str15]